MLTERAGAAGPEDRDRCIWAVLSFRSGENTQILALARELSVRTGWPLEIKALEYRPAGIYNLLRPVGLFGIKPSSRRALRAPWPDLVISASLRNEPPCRWIRRQSGGHSRVVFVGRSWVSPQALDLLIATPQYRVPDHPRVLQNRLTLHDLAPPRLERAAREWQAELAAYPGPRTGVLLGGDAGPYVLGPVAIDRLAAHLNADDCASVLISTSSRTEARLGARLAEQLNKPVFLYEWQSADQRNPYRGILALADRLVVSGDSIAMLSEAVGTGKPVEILDLGAGTWSMGSAPARDGSREDLDLSARWYRLLMRHGHRRWTRDVTLVHRALVAAGVAAWLGEPLQPRRGGAPDDMDAAVARVLSLWGPQAPATPVLAAGTSTKRPSSTL